MIEIVDRLIVDSAEWPDVPGAYAELEDVFEAAAVSDIAWRRTLPWREALAAALARAIREDRRPPRRDGARRRLAALPAGVEVVRESADQVPYREELKPSELLSRS